MKRVNTWRSAALAALACGSALSMASSAQAAAVTFTLVDTGGAGAGTQAYYGFAAATNYWSSVLTAAQPTNIVLNIGFKPLGPNILGSTGSTFDSKAVQSIYTRLAARQGGAFDAQAVANLSPLSPGALGVGALSMYTPGYTDPAAKTGIDNTTKVYDTDGSFNNSVIGLTRANAKALGYTYSDGKADASITFSSNFQFDFNATDGITAGQSDFLGVAIHEIGHALGFVSGVDDYDVLGTGGPLADSTACGVAGGCKNYPANDDWFGETLDLFRYSAPGALDWTTKTASYFSIDGGASSVFNNGLFSTGDYNGDGWQASHWKAPQNDAGNFTCAKPFEGVMNPYLCGGTNGVITGEDLAAFDAIGWNLAAGVGGAGYSFSTRNIVTPVPEPATWAMMIAGFGLAGAGLRVRSRKNSVQALA
ncbi:NF038122 family metalloprotease [Sphingomonas tabacisoli]|uniref:NF038122 family metalloprotease n=1 Tax=Sphingomonas tabacisoli TaxID=2249466 RepID=A0ABW4I443_9SPHN